MAETAAVPQRNEYRLWLGDLQRLSGAAAAANTTYQVARTELEQLLSSQPQNLDIMDTLALLCAGLSDKEAALKYAEDAVRLMPVSKDALGGRGAEMTRAVIYARFADLDRAVPALERLLKLPGGRPPLTPATFLVVGLTGIDLADHQKFSIPFLFAASLVMTMAGVLFGIFTF